MKGHELLAREKPWLAVLKLAIPAMLGTLITLIYNLTDTYFIGLLRDTAQLSAVSVAMPYMWAVSALTSLCCAGAPSVISLLSGAGDTGGAKSCRSFAVFATLGLSLALLAPSIVLIKPTVGLMGIAGESGAHASDYLMIVMLFGCVSAAQGALQGVLRADGRVALATIGSAIGVLLNIALDPLFIFAFDMGVKGAALATGFGNLASLIFFTILARREISLKSALPGWKIAKKVASLSLTSIITSLIMAATMGCTFGMASELGDGFIASISVCSKVYSVIMTLASALAFGIQPFIGFNYAARATVRVRSALRFSLIIGSAMCAFAALAFVLFGDSIIAAFSDDASVLESGANLLRAFAISTPIAALHMTALMYLSATGQAKKSLLAGLGRQLIFFVPALLIIRALFGTYGMIWAYPISDILSTALAGALCFINKRPAKAISALTPSEA